MGVITQRTAYWVDMYRCQPPGFTGYDVDSYIAFIEIGVDEATGRRVGERPPKMGWQYAGEISYVLSNGDIPVFPVIKRVRGGIFIDPDVPVSQVAGLLSAYSQNIAVRPDPAFDEGCQSSSEGPSTEEPSVIASSFIEEVSSGYAELSSLVEISSAQEEVSSPGEEISSAVQEESSAVEISSAVQEESSAVEISSTTPEESSPVEVSSPQEISSPTLEVSSAIEESSPAEVSSPVEISSLQEISSPVEISSEYASSPVPICTALGCPGGVYGTANGTGITEQAAIDDFFADASSSCQLTETDVCAAEVTSTQEVVPGLWVASGRFCCIEGVMVYVFPTLAMNTNEGILEYDFVPGSNPHPVNQETTLTDFYIEGSSSSSVEFLLPNTITGVYFRGEWPRRECLSDGLSTIELFGEFTNPGTTSVVLTYNSTLSDLLSGGQPYFQNTNPGLASIIAMTDIVLTIDDCEIGSSSGGI